MNASIAGNGQPDSPGWKPILIAFYAGERLGGVQFSDPLVALSALSAGWALITPTLVLAAAYLDGYALTRLLHTHPVAHVSVRKKTSYGGTETRREDAGISSDRSAF